MLVTIATLVLQHLIWKKISALPVTTVNLELCCLSHALMDITHWQVLEKRRIVKSVNLATTVSDKLT